MARVESGSYLSIGSRILNNLERKIKAAMPTDEDDQDGCFLFNHLERGDYPAA